MGSHIKNCKNPALQSLVAYMGIPDTVRQRFLDPAMFSSKPELIPECRAFYSAFSDYIAY